MITSGATAADGAPIPGRPVTVEERDGRWSWSVDADVALRDAWFELDGGEDPTIWCHGWQSWSPSGRRTLGVDVDPSAFGPSPSVVRGMHHPDPAIVEDSSLRSELVVGVDGGFLGALGGDHHDTTFRLRLEGERVIVRVQAWLGGAVGGRDLHDVGRFSTLDAWAETFSSVTGARPAPERIIGWCSWYQWFHGFTEADLHRQLGLLDGWPFTVVQVDDAWQAAIGDWTTPAPSWPSGIPAMAEAIAATGRTPGIWLAPFLASPGSAVATDHADWLVQRADGSRPLLANHNPGWGGATYALDCSNPAVLDHVESVARFLRTAGFPYLKLDFLYAASMAGGTHHDPSLTPAQRLRAGLDAVRRGAGDDAFLLGCGCPLGPASGVVDGMRIGPDVAPWWDPKPSTQGLPPTGYDAALPGVGPALAATLARQPMHGRLWQNDPDCLLLRSTDTELTDEQRADWAAAVGASGGMALVSDDLALLGDAERAQLGAATT